ncbi:siderophore-interacting protein [soil metagenome]
MESTDTTRRVQRLRHDLKRRTLTVTRVEQPGPHLRRIVFTSADLGDFVSMSFDDHIKAFFPLPDGQTAGRDYTPRSFDTTRRELTIEFALHGEGPAATWASQATVGQTLDIGGPKGSFIVPVDYDWHLLIGDETALPAIARRLEELPSDAKVIVIAHVADSADRPAFQRPGLDLRWTSSPQATLDAVDHLTLPEGEGYAWCAGESAEMAEVRKRLVDGKLHDRHAIRAAAYWKRGANGHHENFD